MYKTPILSLLVMITQHSCESVSTCTHVYSIPVILSLTTTSKILTWSITCTFKHYIDVLTGLVEAIKVHLTEGGIRSYLITPNPSFRSTLQTCIQSCCFRPLELSWQTWPVHLLPNMFRARQLSCQDANNSSIFKTVLPIMVSTFRTV